MSAKSGSVPSIKPIVYDDLSAFELKFSPSDKDTERSIVGKFSFYLAQMLNLPTWSDYLVTSTS